MISENTPILTTKDKTALLFKTVIVIAIGFAIGTFVSYAIDTNNFSGVAILPILYAYLIFTVIFFPIMLARRLPNPKAAYIGACIPFLIYLVHVYSIIQMTTCGGQFCEFLGILISLGVTIYAPVFALVYCIASKVRTGNGRWSIFWKVLLVDAIIVGLAYAWEFFF
jgi:uncharacterized membrane protein